METIKILQRLVIEKCKSGLTEKEILENAFDLLLIFDDVVTLGYRESVTQQQVNEYLLMSSNQENLDKMLKMAKEVLIGAIFRTRLKRSPRSSLGRKPRSKRIFPSKILRVRYKAWCRK